MNTMLAYSPNIFGTNVSWYAFFVLLGAMTTYVLVNYFYKKEENSKQKPDFIENLFLIAFPSGILGARIWYVFSEWSYYSNNFLEIFKIWNGGLAIQGGVLFGILAGVIYYKIKKIDISLFRLFDIVIPNILIAQVIGRWGNFFNQEVYGACVNRSSLNFIPNFILNNMEVSSCSVGQVAQPLFLYESILNFIGFILISIVLRKFFTKRIDGELTSFYFIWYGVVRLIMEPFRNEVYIMRFFGNVSMSVLMSILFIILGVAFIFYLRFEPILKKQNLNKKNEEEENEQEENL